MTYTIFFDFETSGLELSNPPIQLASIVVDEDWVEVAHFEAKLQFDMALATPEALAMNHYDPQIWARDAISPSLAVNRFTEFTRPYLSIPMVSKRTGRPYNVGKLAGHNAQTFDFPVLKKMYEGSFFPFAYFVKDTLARALWFYDEHPEIQRPANLKLATLCEALGIPVDNAHDALADVRMCAAVAKGFYGAERKANEVDIFA